jgi:hypothetical protein
VIRGRVDSPGLKTAARLLFAFLVLFLAHAAQAEPASAVSIEYSAPAGCPRSDAFAAELASRTPRARVVAPGPGVRALVVHIRPAHKQFAGRVTVREPDGQETERAVAGDSCMQVMTALALIAAVAVDPTAANASATPSATSASGTSGNTAPSSSTTASTPAASSAPPAAFSSAAPAASSSAPPDELPPAQPSPQRPGSWTFAVGAHAGAIDGVAPDVLLLIPVFVEAARESDSVFAPAARLRVERTGSGTVASGDAHAQFTWTAAALDLCPLKLGAGRFDARPCVRFEGGTLEAAGVDVQPSRSGARPWLSTGAAARARVFVVGPLFLEAEASLALALVRDRFFVEPSQTVFRAPLVGWSATGGVGVQFR